jgi:hypothetical protein
MRRARLAASLALLLPLTAAGQDRSSPVDLVQAQLTVPSKVQVGKRFFVIDVVENVGEAGATPTITGFCLSKTETCGPDGLKFAARRVPSLESGQTHQGESRLELPASVEPGTYFLIVTANANSDVTERYRDNNVLARKLEVKAKK